MSTAQTWDANLYDSKHGFVAAYGRGVVDLLAPQPAERILDVGCGTGTLTAEIAATGAEVCGFDASPQMIAAARKHAPQLRFDVMDATTFAYESPFDAVFSNATLHWVRPPEAAVRCMHNALRPGGRLVVEFGGHLNVEHTSRALCDAIHAVTGLRVWHTWYFPSIGEYATLLAAHGLEPQACWLFDRPSRLEGDDGYRNWVQQFGEHMLCQAPVDAHAAILDHAERLARPLLMRDGVWNADYRRLRVKAVRV
jgi:trans-aconitate methyltransferase